LPNDITKLPLWVQRRIAVAEANEKIWKARAAQTEPDGGEFRLGASRLHIRKIGPDEIDVNFSGLFLDVLPKACNHIVLRGRSFVRLTDR
jgi:hypothetical protein